MAWITAMGLPYQSKPQTSVHDYQRGGTRKALTHPQIVCGPSLAAADSESTYAPAKPAASPTLSGWRTPPHRRRWFHLKTRSHCYRFESVTCFPVEQ
jgi:hypothetical protein